MTRYWHVIDAGLGTAPPADPAVWTRLSGADRNAVRSVLATRVARSKSVDQAEQGTAQFVLNGYGPVNNPTYRGALDPTNPSGPYYGRLVNGCPIRCRITDGTSFWPEWRGFVRRWPMSESSKGVQDAQIDCYGPLGWLAGASPPYPNELHRLIMASNPSSYWPCNDPAGSIVVRDVVAGFDGILNGAAAAGGPSLTVEGDGGSMTVSNLPGDFAQAPAGAMPVPPFSVHMLVRVASTPPANGRLLWTGSTGFVVTTGIGPTMVAVANGAAGVTTTYPGAVPGLVPGLFPIVMTYDLAGTLNVTVLGYKSSGAHAYQAPGAASSLQWGGSLGAAGSNGVGCQIGHVAVWPRVVSDAEIYNFLQGALYARGPVGYRDTAAERITFLLNQVGWPAAMVAGTLGGQVIGEKMGPVRMGGVPPVSTLDRIRDVVRYDDGVLGETADGKVLFWPHSVTPNNSFAVGGSSAPKVSAAYSMVETTAISQVATSDPPVVLNSDSTSINNGRQVTINEMAATADDAWLIAQRTLQLGQASQPGIDAVTLNPVDTPACLTMDVGNTGTVKRRPIWSPVDIAERHQISSVTATGSGGTEVERTFGMIRPHTLQLRLRCTQPTPPALTGATAPNTAAMSPANLSVEVFFRLANWNTPAAQVLCAHGDNAPETAGWMFVWNAPYMIFYYVNNGGVIRATQSAKIYRTGTRFMWAKVTFDPTTGTVTFYTSNFNRTAYTQFGATVYGGSSLKAYSGAMQVGQDPSAANGADVTGDILIVRYNTLAGVPIASFDPTADAQPAPGAVIPSTWTASTGEVWSKQGSGTLDYA